MRTGLLMMRDSVTTRIPRQLGIAPGHPALAPTLRQEYEPKVVLEPEALAPPELATLQTPSNLKAVVDTPQLTRWFHRIPLPVFFPIGVLLGIVVSVVATARP